MVGVGSPASDQIDSLIRYPATSTESLTIIKQWLDTCGSSHPECRNQVDSRSRPAPSTLPKRVIDVGLDDPSHHPRLVISNGRRAEYIALSHCWGAVHPLKTTKTNMNVLMEGIPLDQLPATFSDTVRLARLLRVRYVWIDSLCIIQDSAADWEQEAATMGTIYNSAYVTIAATRSPNPQSGFLSDKVSEYFPKGGLGGTFELPCRQGNRTAGTFFVTAEPKADPSKHIEDAALNHRGWVLQERLLSRRVLHFAEDQVYWECRHHAIAQDRTVFKPQGNSNFLFPLPGLIRRLYLLRDTTMPWAAADKEFQQIWLTILEFYCSCQLTFDKDRLVALLGFADQLRPLTTRTYVDGHWFRLLPSQPDGGDKLLPDHGDVPQSLLWISTSPSNRLPTTFRAPSWSWASIEGEISFHNRQHDIHPKLVSVERFLAAPGIPTIVGPRLNIKGEFVSASVVLADGGPHEKKRVFEVVERGKGKQSARGVGAVMGNVTFDLPGTVCPDVECLYLFTDSTRYSVFLALSMVMRDEELGRKPGGKDAEGQEDGEVECAVYRRVGIGSMLQGRRAMFKDTREVVLV